MPKLDRVTQKVFANQAGSLEVPLLVQQKTRRLYIQKI